MSVADVDAGYMASTTSISFNSVVVGAAMLFLGMLLSSRDIRKRGAAL